MFVELNGGGWWKYRWRDLVSRARCVITLDHVNTDRNYRVNTRLGGQRGPILSAHLDLLLRTDLYLDLRSGLCVCVDKNSLNVPDGPFLFIFSSCFAVICASLSTFGKGTF